MKPCESKPNKRQKGLCCRQGGPTRIMRLPRIALLGLAALPFFAQAQFQYVITNGAISITGYTGPGGTVVIPEQIECLPVRSIGAGAFGNCFSLTNLILPDSIKAVGESAFAGCYSLTSVSLPENLSTIGAGAFGMDYNLLSIIIPESVTSIGDGAFAGAFGIGLTSIYFEGSPPAAGENVFLFAPTTVNYLLGIPGWGDNFGGAPTAPWYPGLQASGGGGHGFHLTTMWARHHPVVVEMSTNFANPGWIPVQTNILIEENSAFFDVPDWFAHQAAFYRVRGGPHVPGEPASFQNLGFESATLVTVPSGFCCAVDPVAALPGWTVWWDTNLAPFVLYDAAALDSSCVSIFDNQCTNFAPLFRGAAFEGQFMVLLQSSLSLRQDQLQPVAISKTQRVPDSATTLTFDALLAYPADPGQAFAVTLAGENLPLSVVSSNPCYVVYGADISSFRGQTLELRFTAFPGNIPTNLPHNDVLLDDIRFLSIPLEALKAKR